MDPQKPKKHKPDGGSPKEPKEPKEKKHKSEGKEKSEGKHKGEGKSKGEGKHKGEEKHKGEGKDKSETKDKPHSDKPHGHTPKSHHSPAGHSPPAHLPPSHYQTDHQRQPHSSNVPRLPSKSKQIPDAPDPSGHDVEVKRPFWKNCYDKETKECCGRTCMSWIQIIVYGIMYLIFLATYTMIFLLLSLTIIKYNGQYMDLSEKDQLFMYSGNGIGLSAVPSSNDIEPLIWYRSGEEKQYEKYISALDKLLKKDHSKKSREKREVDALGPCGVRPYGYGKEPCVIIKINKQIGWSSKPMQPDSPAAASAPDEIQRLLKMKPQKLWLNCDGYYPWDREHLGTIKYYPDPPGFDPNLYPLNMSSPSPLVGIQIKNFTLGLSISIQCKLWYERGTSTLEFVLYVAHPRTF